METSNMKTLNHFKSWWQTNIIEKDVSLEDKQKLLAEMEAEDDATIYDISDEMIAWVREQIS
jgi:hypothetical protein